MVLFRSLFFSSTFWGVATISGVTAFVGMRSLTSLPLAFATLTDPEIPLYTGVAFLLRTIHFSLVEYSTNAELFVTIGAALLIGFNCALFIFSSRVSRVSSPRFAVSVGAFVSAIGVGCAACGPVLVYAIAAQFGGLGLISLLPYGGVEIGYLGLAILVIATAFMLHALHRTTCPIR